MSTVQLRLLRGEREEMAQLQRILEEAPDYAHRVTGCLPGKADAQSTYSILPEGKTYDDKFVFGVYLNDDLNDEMIGCIDIIRGYPDEQTATIGLLLLSEKQQHKGCGGEAYERLEKIIKEWGVCRQVRIGVIRTNDIVLPYLRKMGFRENGDILPFRYNHVESETIILEKPL